MRELARRIDRFQERFGRGVSWLSLGMVLVVFADVVSRYLFRYTSGGMQELEWYLFGTLYLLAAGYTLLHDEHVRVDIVYSKLSPRRRAWLDFVLFWVVLLPLLRARHLHRLALRAEFVGGVGGLARSGRAPAPLAAQVDDHRGLRPPAGPGHLRDHQVVLPGDGLGDAGSDTGRGPLSR